MQKLDEDIETLKVEIEKLELNEWKDMSVIEIMTKYQILIDLCWSKINYLINKNNGKKS